MLPSINKELLPMKGHYLFFNAATAPVIPFLPVMARQLGFSGTIVGIIYTVLPIVGMLIKPIMGGVADRFHCKKLLFLLFQIFVATSLFGINFISEIPTESKVHFACDDGAAALDTTASNISITDTCAAYRIAAENNNSTILDCKMSCEVANELLFTTVCEHWKGLKYCTGKRPEKFDFIAHVPLDKIDVLDHIMFLRVTTAKLVDGSEVKPICPNSTFQISTVCDMNCNSHAINNLISKPRLKDEEVMQLPQFWLFLMLAVIGWSSMAVVVSVGDAICFEILGDKPNLYGNQRLWGAVGWGLFSVFAGLMVDAYSDGDTKKDYSSVFYLMLGMMVLDLLVSSKLQYSQTKISTNILRDVGKLLTRPHIVVFLIWCVFVGACTGFIWQFLFWHLEDLATKYEGNGGGCGMHTWIKTLEGLVMGVQCLGGELPFFFLSGYILKRVGHVNCMSIVLLGIGVRYLLYSVLVNPWWVLPVELTNGITFGLFYATMASYASIAAPRGTEATIQGLVGAVFEGVGVSLGSLIGGILYDEYGGWVTFRIFGIASLICCVIHILVQRFLIKSPTNDKESPITAGYTTPREAIRILDEDMQDSRLVYN